MVLPFTWKPKHTFIFKNMDSRAVKTTKRLFVKIFSSGASCPSNKKDCFSPMTAEEKHEY